MMANIHILDDITVDKIAAGEVVERPASVVKELVENAIDANSTKIEVEIMAGGTSFIRISDNGEGMDNKNARLAILRHATSKIRNVDDLTTIDSLGFRGEALPSIAAVSRFHLLTRQKDQDLGTSVKLAGGKVLEMEEAGCGLGTTIKVEDLFFNIPARKKFLKTNTTEGNKINDFMIKLALSKPEVSFKFINNNRLCMSTPGNNSSYDVIEAIYGNKVSEELLLIEYKSDDIEITGFISKPAVIRSNRTWQTVLINGRIIASRVIYKAIDNAYHSLLPKSGYPFVLLDIKIDKRALDINVHPQKADVKFEDEGKIFKAVYGAVLEAVKPKENESVLGDFAAPVANSFIDKNAVLPETMPLIMEDDKNVDVGLHRGNFQHFQQPVTEYTDNDLARFRNIQAEILAEADKIEEAKQETSAVDNQSSEFDLSDYRPPLAAGVSEEDIKEQEDLIRQTGEMYPIGQIDKCFIIAQGYYGGMFIIDQHAAHERILYDRFGKQKEDMAIQPLLIHLFLPASREEIEAVEQHKDILLKLGFEVELAGQQQLRLMAIPADLDMKDGEETFREILGKLINLHEPTPKEIRHSCIAMTACKAAIKAGDELSLTQMEVLLQELSSTTLPYTCPHGRPTIVKFSTYDLEKMFKRVK